MITKEQRAELNQIEKRLYNDYQKELRRERLRYLQKVNTIKKGDIIKDHIGRIQVEECDLHNSTDACLIFIGTIINANGKPNKKGEKRPVYAMNIRP